MKKDNAVQISKREMLSALFGFAFSLILAALFARYNFITILVCFFVGVFLLLHVVVKFYIFFPSLYKKFILRYVVCVSLLIVFGFLGFLSFYSPPVKLAFDLRRGNYSDGTEIAGIKWHYNMPDVRIIFENASGDDYTNINAILETDLHIFQAGILNDHGVGGCVVIADVPFEMELYGYETETKRSITVPVDPDNNLPAIAPKYRLYCDKIPAGKKIEVVLEIIDNDPLYSDRTMRPRFYFGDQVPSWVKVDLRYKDNVRDREIISSFCFEKKCSFDRSRFGRFAKVITSDGSAVEGVLGF